MEFSDEDPSTPKVHLIDITGDSNPQTPTLSATNEADAYDWQHRANIIEQKLSLESDKLQREKRKTRRLQTQINEYTDALARSTQDCAQVMKHCQLASDTNMAITQELRRSKVMVETLEAVIVLLFKVDMNGEGKFAARPPGSVASI